MTTINVENMLEIFTSEISGHSGQIIDTARQDGRAFMRSVLPYSKDVRREDKLHAGMALKATPDSVTIHPYVFRQVCWNGCIFGQSDQSRVLVNIGGATCLEINGKIEEVAADRGIEEVFRETVSECCSKDAFTECFKHFRHSLSTTITDKFQETLVYTLNLQKFPSARALSTRIIKEYLAEDESTLFSMINAITAVAREEPDPGVKWKLECFAGQMAMLASTPVARVKPPAQAGQVETSQTPLRLQAV